MFLTINYLVVQCSSRELNLNPIFVVFIRCWHVFKSAYLVKIWLLFMASLQGTLQFNTSPLFHCLYLPSCLKLIVSLSPSINTVSFLVLFHNYHYDIPPSCTPASFDTGRWGWVGKGEVQTKRPLPLRSTKYGLHLFHRIECCCCWLPMLLIGSCK